MLFEHEKVWGKVKEKEQNTHTQKIYSWGHFRVAKASVCVSECVTVCVWVTVLMRFVVKCADACSMNDKRREMETCESFVNWDANWFLSHKRVSSSFHHLYCYYFFYLVIMLALRVINSWYFVVDYVYIHRYFWGKWDNYLKECWKGSVVEWYIGKSEK